MPLHIAPSFLKLFLLLYSGLGEVEGRERNRKGNSTKPRPPAEGPCLWPMEGPVLKPQHLECKMQFHSAAAPSGASEGLWAGQHWGDAEQSLLGQLPRARNGPAGAVLGSEQSPQLMMAVLGCPALFKAEPSPGSGSAPGVPQQPGLRGRCCWQGSGGVGRTGTGRQRCTEQPVLVPRGDTKLVIV